jgi:hypothetical protein
MHDLLDARMKLVEVESKFKKWNQETATERNNLNMASIHMNQSIEEEDSSNRELDDVRDNFIETIRLLKDKIKELEK